MKQLVPIAFIIVLSLDLYSALDLQYLDPTILQTKTSAEIQQHAAAKIIKKYSSQVTVEVNPILFSEKKDMFSLRTADSQLHIRASSGVAAVWGFNYYLKKYCKSHIGWQVKHVFIPDPLPEVDEAVVSNDRFRYYQNVCTASYSFVWWSLEEWLDHIEWMALNGINLALAPVAQEHAWTRIYQQLGMTQDEIDEHFTGPAFLSWLRMGNLRGWGGPLLKSWHDQQLIIQNGVIDSMYQLGIIPVMPAFSGHVPRALERLYPNSTLFSVGKWNNFNDDYCCGLFLSPSDPLFQEIGLKFLKEITAETGTNHIYSADPFNEIKVQPWSTALVQETARAIYSTLSQFDQSAVWLMQNWLFVHDPLLWPRSRVKSFLTSVPFGRLLVLDLQSEQWPQYDLYEQYFGQPFIWCMLHNFGATLGMFGNLQAITKDVYEARANTNTSMIGVGLTPEGINQNYVVYDLMLESAWRKEPVADLDSWLEQYAVRRYGCNATGIAWRYLHKSVYSFHGLNKMRGKYAITRRPSFNLQPWAWYKSHDLIEAWRRFTYVPSNICNTPGYLHDLVDVSRQALQYRAEQLYLNVVDDWYSNTWAFNTSINLFFGVMSDMTELLASNNDFTSVKWLAGARTFGKSEEEAYLYQLNARNQITLWGPNGEISDYACKQWAELFQYYYTPRWRAFLNAALNAKVKGESFDEKTAQNIVRATVEKDFMTVHIRPLPQNNARSLAISLYKKWSLMPGLKDLPIHIIKQDPGQRTTLSDLNEEEFTSPEHPTVTMLFSTTPAR